MVTDQFTPVHNPGVLHYHLLDEMVVYHPATFQAASLNESAREIWELCDGTRTIEHICLELARPRGIEPAQLREDVMRGVSRLCDLGFFVL